MKRYILFILIVFLVFNLTSSLQVNRPSAQAPTHESKSSTLALSATSNPHQYLTFLRFMSNIHNLENN